MKNFAVIDIGSNSVRLMFVADGKILYKRLNTTRLGEGLAMSGVLKEEAIERSAKAVSDFAAQAKAEGAENVYAFATAAVRSAQNGGQFTARVCEYCNINVEVIAGEMEAEIGIMGALGEQDGAVVDIGGASTEIVVKEKGVLIYKKSIDIGVVRLKDMCGRDKNQLISVSKEHVKHFGAVPKSVVHGIGGTATTLGALALGLQEYDSEKITGFVLHRAKMQELSNQLLKMSVDEIAQLSCVPKGRADVLTGGAVWLNVLMDELGFDEIVISDRDNLEGYAIRKGLM